MREINGTSNKVLEVDLTTKSFSVFEVPPRDLDMFMSGKGLGLKLLYDRMRPGVDPLGEENMIAFVPGVLMGTGAPCSGRFETVTKSPLTGIMCCGSCGGPFGMALKTSGWDGLVIRGSAKAPTYLFIDSQGVQFRDARRLWGKDTAQSQAMLSKEGDGAAVIGPAGENLVRYANISSGHRFVGRGGMGAVMGAKKLKAVVAKGGEFAIIPKEKKKFDRARKKLNAYINRNNISAGTYRSFGTSANVNLSNAAGILPVRNFSGGTHGEAHKISGETMQKKHNTKFHTCKPCTILCGHKGNFGGKERAVPEYETVGLLGSNLEIFDPVAISEFNEICGLMGMDTISAGGTIAWAAEATERGLFKSNLKFGEPEPIAQALRDIAHMKGIGKELALGSRELSRRYGGEDFAIHVKGMEMAAYDPRGCFGHGLSYATANRGACHLSGPTFPLEAYFNMAEPFAKRGKAYMVQFFENVYAALNSLHICFFTAFPVFFEPPLVKLSPVPMLKLLTQNITPLALNVMDISLWPKLWRSVTGMRMGTMKFKKNGKRIHILERYMNAREGISRKDDTLPLRMTHESRSFDTKGRMVPLDKMLRKYYRLRGYDKNGIPTDRTLRRLGIEKK